MALLAHGGNVAADAAKDFSAAPTAKATGHFLADLGHAQVTFGQVIVERDPEVVHEGQHRPWIVFEAEQDVANWSLCGSAALAGAFGRRVGTQALRNQVLILLTEVVAAPRGELRLARIPGALDSRLDLEQQLGQALWPVLPGDFTDGGQVAQQVRIAQAVLAAKSEVGTQRVM